MVQPIIDPPENPERPKPKTTEELKQDALAKIRIAAKACYDWYGSCDVGPERTRAAEIYETVLNAPRNR